MNQEKGQNYTGDSGKAHERNFSDPPVYVAIERAVVSRFLHGNGSSQQCGAYTLAIAVCAGLSALQSAFGGYCFATPQANNASYSSYFRFQTIVRHINVYLG